MFGFLKSKVKEIVEKVTKEKEEPKKDKLQEKPKQEQKPKSKKSPDFREEGKGEEGKGDVGKGGQEFKPGANKAPESRERRSEADGKKEDKPPEKKKSGFSFFSRKVSEKDLEELKLGLIRSNMALEAAEKIIGGLRDVEAKDFQAALRKQLLEVLGDEKLDFVEFVKEKLKEQPAVTVLFFGFNGAGKTTAIARIGYLLKQKKIPVVFAAADTFRAAAIEQISKHGENIGVDVIKHKYGGDPAAVVFDARKRAEKIHGVVLADTAGRLHTDKNLMEELKKVKRVNKPDLSILVLDSLTGSDVLTQIENFSDIGFDGLVFTKVDINEKGGSIFSVRQATDKPILFLGVGQEYGDLMEFDPKKLVEKLDL
jgi:fused signal recognition particle receptor